jgi:misacylated tRNA(Ala) deacylase
VPKPATWPAEAGPPRPWYSLSGDEPTPPAGTELECEVDWERRYALMRTHTALHILCAVVWRDHGAKVTGANMEPLRGRMDFEFEHLSGEFVRELEAKCNEEVAAARATRVDFLSREDADRDPDLIRSKVSLLPPAIRVVRVVGIEGLDLQADGGTHVADTSEVGAIALPSYKSKGRLNKRIELQLDAD